MPDGNYHCVIDSSLSNGKMNLIEAILPGKSSKEIFFSSYLCHPSMANNELSGPVVLSEILEYIKSMPQRFYTYRFVLVPETIGSIAYLSRRLNSLKDHVIAGYNLSCVGDERRFTHLQSRSGNTLADQALAAAIKNKDRVVTKSFSFRGSDERQYNAPGIDLPVCGFSRSKYGDYPEYHTSLDDFNVVTQKGLQGSLDVMKDIIDAFETGIYPVIKVLTEPQLGKRGLYPNLSNSTASVEDSRLINDLSIRMDVTAHSDGKTTIFSIADLAECSLRKILEEVSILSTANLVTCSHTKKEIINT